MRTSNLLRDWLLLQLRRGVTSDDQATLFAAEQRGRAMGALRVGQIPSSFAAAFYSTTKNFFPRITRVIQGPAYLLHCPPSEAARWCDRFNAHRSRRQMWMTDKNSLRIFESVTECRRTLRVKKCPFAGAGVHALGSAVFEPVSMKPPSTLRLSW